MDCTTFCCDGAVARHVLAKYGYDYSMAMFMLQVCSKIKFIYFVIFIIYFDASNDDSPATAGLFMHSRAKIPNITSNKA